MPTKNPRVFLTMSPELLAVVDALAAKLGKNRPGVIRVAVRALAKAKLP